MTMLLSIFYLEGRKIFLNLFPHKLKYPFRLPLYNLDQCFKRTKKSKGLKGNKATLDTFHVFKTAPLAKTTYFPHSHTLLQNLISTSTVHPVATMFLKRYPSSNSGSPSMSTGQSLPLTQALLGFILFLTQCHHEPPGFPILQRPLELLSVNSIKSLNSSSKASLCPLLLFCKIGICAIY